MCYVPPSDSSRSLDLTEISDAVVYQVHVCCKNKTFYTCGDFNRMVGSPEGFISGMDTLSERNVVDVHLNKVGEHLCDFLLDTLLYFKWEKHFK